jgi:hypothetical protein
LATATTRNVPPVSAGSLAEGEVEAEQAPMSSPTSRAAMIGLRPAELGIRLARGLMWSQSTDDVQRGRGDDRGSGQPGNRFRIHSPTRDSGLTPLGP